MGTKSSTKALGKFKCLNFGAKYVWVVLRHEVDYLSSAKLNDELMVHTWKGASFGVKSERFVEIKKESKIIAKAKTIW